MGQHIEERQPNTSDVPRTGGSEMSPRTDGGKRNPADGTDDRNTNGGERREQPDGQQRQSTPQQREGQRQPQDQPGQNQPQGRQQQSAQGQHPPQGGGPPSGGQPQDVDDGYSRRELMIGGAGAVAAVGAGWFLFARDSTPGGPEGVVYQMADAMESGDVEAMDDLVHEQAPVRDGFGGDNPIEETRELDQMMAAAEAEGVNFSLSITVEETEVIEQESTDAPGIQEAAVVEATLTTSVQTEDISEEDEDTSTVLVVQNDDGDWKYWSEGDSLPEQN